MSEVKRFPLGASKAASAKSAEGLRGRRGERGPAGPAGPAGPPGETKVVYVDKSSGSSSGAKSALIKATAGKNAVLINSVAGITVPKFVTTQYNIQITPSSHTDQGEAYSTVEICHPTDLAGQRHIQVYERICPPEFSSKCGVRKCPCNCLENIIGCIVSTKCPTTFDAVSTDPTVGTKSQIVGAWPYSAYAALAAGAGFSGLETVSIGAVVPSKAAICAEAAGANAMPDNVVKSMTSANFSDNYDAFAAEVAGLTAVDESASRLLLVHADDSLKASQRRAKFSWYLATLTATVTAAGPPAEVEYTVTPLSLCSYPSDTVWANFRDRGVCVALPTRQTVDPDTTLFPDSACGTSTGRALGVPIGEKTPNYWTVPGYKYPEDSTKNINGKWTYGDRSSSADQGYIPQGTASHPIALLYCIREPCCPSMLCLRAGLPDGQGNVPHKIWGFRLTRYDADNKVFTRVVPALHTFGQGVDEGSWAITTEADAVNGQYCIKDAELCIPIDEQESVDEDDSTVPVCTKLCSDRWQLELILSPSRSKAKFTVTDFKLLGEFSVQGEACPVDNADWWKVEPHPRTTLTDLIPNQREISILQVGHNRTRIYFAATNVDKVFKINVQTPAEIQVGDSVINDEIMDRLEPTSTLRDLNGNVNLTTTDGSEIDAELKDILETVYEEGLGLPHTGVCAVGGNAHASSGIVVQSGTTTGGFPNVGSGVYQA